MTTSVNADQGLYSLPNELLYTIIEPLSTKTILNISPTSRRVHALCVRLLHNRLTLAASLADHVLYLEAYPPSAKLTATGLYCEPLGTPGLHLTLESPDDAGKIGRFGNLYSRFRPQRTEPKKKTVPRPGDIPGSRTHPATNAGESSSQAEREPELIGETVSLDAHELFTQLCTVVHMVKMARKGIFDQLVEVSDGMIRVWRDWLKKQAENGNRNKYDEIENPAKDERILWVNKGDHIVGVRCAIKERKRRRDNPILVASDEEVAVSYFVEFQELYIRTTHLLFKLEESVAQETNRSGKAVVFRGAVA